MPELSEQEQFEQLLTPGVHRRAWRYACRLKSTREDAEDLLQDALVRAYRGLHRLRHTERFGAWLISIIRNCHLSRRHRHHQQNSDSYWLQLVKSSSVENPLSESIAEALTKLPAAQREILSLFYLDGLSLEETGWVLGVAPQVVGQRLYRARRALRKKLGAIHMPGLSPRGASREI